AAKHPREPRDLLDVRSGISPHTSRVPPVHLVDAIAVYFLPLRDCDAELPRHRLQTVIGHGSRGEVVPQDRVERVDELPARCDESHAPARVPVALALDASPR